MSKLDSLPARPRVSAPPPIMRRVFRGTGAELGLVAAIVAVVVLTNLLDHQHTYWRELQAYGRGFGAYWSQLTREFSFQHLLALPAAPPSLMEILRLTSMLGIFALGSAIVIISGGIDLSSGSVIAFSGTTCATMMLLLAPDAMQSFDKPVGLGIIALAMTATLVTGFLIGSLHAWLITVIGLPPFVATLATLVGLRSLGRAIVKEVTLQVSHSSKTQIQIFDTQFRYLTTNKWIPVIIFAALALVCWILMSKTVIGRRLHALGGNEQAARLSGIRTDRLKWLAYCISAILASIAGILYISDQSVADPQTLGRGYELNAIAAAVVGGCSLLGGVGTMPGTVLGALFLQVVMDGVAKIIKADADTYEGLIVGGVVVLAVALSQLRLAGRRSKPFFGGGLGIVTILNLTLFAGVMAMLFGRSVPWGARLGAWKLGGMAAGIMFAVLVLGRVIKFVGRGRRLRNPRSQEP